MINISSCCPCEKSKELERRVAWRGFTRRKTYRISADGVVIGYSFYPARVLGEGGHCAFLLSGHEIQAFNLLELREKTALAFALGYHERAPGFVQT